MRPIAIPFVTLLLLACGDTTAVFWTPETGTGGAGGHAPKRDPTSTSAVSAGGGGTDSTTTSTSAGTGAGEPESMCSTCLDALKGVTPDDKPVEKADSGRSLVTPCAGASELWAWFWDETCSGSCAEACPKLCTLGEFTPSGNGVPESWLWLDCVACVTGPGNSDPGPFEACAVDMP